MIVKPVGLLRVCVWILWLCSATGQAPGDEDGQAGYIAGEDYLMEPLDVDESGMLALCPTDRVMRTRGGCGAGVGDDAGAGEQLECVRLHCCAGYVYVARRCLPEGTAPCGGDLALCEQRCRAQAGLVWCTCFPGYAFSAARYRQRIPPYCLDVDECAEAERGGCDGRCVNTLGGFHCECDEGTLASDGRQCLPSATKRQSSVSGQSEAALWAGLQALAAQLRQLQAAPRTRYPLGDEEFAEGGSVYRVLDSTAPLEGGYCRCERGPRGPPGAPGMVGEKGDPGERGPRGAGGLGGRRALDAILALVGELRAELATLRLALSRGERPPPFLPHQPLAERAFRPLPRTYTHPLQDDTQFASGSDRSAPEEVTLRNDDWLVAAADGSIYDILADFDVNAYTEDNYDGYD